MPVTTRSCARRRAENAKALGTGLVLPALVVENILRMGLPSKLLPLARVCRLWRRSASFCYKELREAQQDGLNYVWFHRSVWAIDANDRSDLIETYAVDGLLQDLIDLNVTIDVDNDGVPTGSGFCINGTHYDMRPISEALHTACINGELSTVRWMTNAWRLPELFKFEIANTVFACACDSLDPSMVKFVGEKYTLVDHTTNPFRDEITHNVISTNSLEFVDYVITKCGLTKEDFVRAKFMKYLLGVDASDHFELIIRKVNFSRAELVAMLRHKPDRFLKANLRTIQYFCEKYNLTKDEVWDTTAVGRCIDTNCRWSEANFHYFATRYKLTSNDFLAASHSSSSQISQHWRNLLSTLAAH